MKREIPPEKYAEIQSKFATFKPYNLAEDPIVEQNYDDKFLFGTLKTGEQALYFWEDDTWHMGKEIDILLDNSNPYGVKAFWINDGKNVSLYEQKPKKFKKRTAKYKSIRFVAGYAICQLFDYSETLVDLSGRREDITSAVPFRFTPADGFWVTSSSPDIDRVWAHSSLVSLGTQCHVITANRFAPYAAVYQDGPQKGKITIPFQHHNKGGWWLWDEASDRALNPDHSLRYPFWENGFHHFVKGVQLGLDCFAFLAQYYDEYYIQFVWNDKWEIVPYTGTNPDAIDYLYEVSKLWPEGPELWRRPSLLQQPS